MTSRTASPLSVSSSSPGRSPAASAGEPGATATTRAVGIAPVYGSGPTWSGATLDRVPVEQVLLAQPRGLLRGRGDGDQGPVVDGAGVRAAGVLLPRDRPQPARGRPVPRARAWSSSTTSTTCPPARRSCSRPTARRPRWSPRPATSDRFVVNAVCPLVTKVHHEAKVRAGQGLHGPLRRATPATTRRPARWRSRPTPIRLVEHEEDLDDVLPTVADPSKVALLAQTTLSLHDWEGIIDRARERVPRAVDRDPQRPLLRDHQPAGRAAGDRGARPTPSW